MTIASKIRVGSLLFPALFMATGCSGDERGSSFVERDSAGVTISSSASLAESATWTLGAERDLPIPGTVPAVTRVETDARGYLWIARYRLPWESATTWDVLSPGGRWLTSVAIPSSYDILQIGESGILVRQVDELGIERIARYPLHRDASDDPAVENG